MASTWLDATLRNKRYTVSTGYSLLKDRSICSTGAARSKRSRMGRVCRDRQNKYQPNSVVALYHNKLRCSLLPIELHALVPLQYFSVRKASRPKRNTIPSNHFVFSNVCFSLPHAKPNVLSHTDNYRRYKGNIACASEQICTICTSN